MPTLYLPRVTAYSVPSGSRPGKNHTVQITERGEAQCSCEDWEFHASPRYRCKHIKAVMTSEKLAPAIIKTNFVYPTEEAAIADLKEQAEDDKEIEA